jgi:hypothetical protein
MSQRLVPLAVFAVIASSTALLLSGCFLIPSPTPAPTATGAPPTSTEPGTPTASATATDEPVPTPTGAATGAGCSPNSDTMPAGAVHRQTIDVDGDGLADTEWISATPTLEFGVTTASGATFSYPLSSAAPTTREGFIARLNDHRIISLVDDGRAAYAHFFGNCKWVETKTFSGTPYPLDFNDFAGIGSGVGCSLGYVVQFQATLSGGTYTVTKTPLNLNTDGSKASGGTAVTVVSGAPASDSRVKVAKELSCQAVTVSNGGVSVG